jgi:hypothetical protein
MSAPPITLGPMSVARYKDLCIDTSTDERLGRFWAAALGLEFTPDGAAGVLSGAEPSMRVWMNAVPEDKTVKQRVHIDVHAASIDELVGLGATVLEPAEEYGRRWTVLADPDGGEFCAFVRAPEALQTYRFYELNIDAVDDYAIATWWWEVLGGKLGRCEDERFSWIDEVPGLPYDLLVFAPVPEPKTVKNRIHWDVLVESVDDLIGSGATMLREPDDEISWSIMADPEGNEFCAFTPSDG